jgi:hypothetical protein
MFAAEPDPPQFWDGLMFGSWDIMLLHRYRGRIHHRTTGASHWGLMSIDRQRLPPITERSRD